MSTRSSMIDICKDYLDITIASSTLTQNDDCDKNGNDVENENQQEILGHQGNR